MVTGSATPWPGPGSAEGVKGAFRMYGPAGDSETSAGRQAHVPTPTLVFVGPPTPSITGQSQWAGPRIVLDVLFGS